MNRSDSPKKQPVPFGLNGQRENLLSTTPAGDNTASYDAGFPPVTMILKAAGGLPPKGQDMNQILYELSSLSRWNSAGALNTFDSDFASVIGGYPLGSVLISDDGKTQYQSTIDNNKNNPNTNSTGWMPPSGVYGLGIRNEKIPSTMASVDVSKFDYFAPKDNIGPLPGQWVGGITHAMGDQIGWQIAGLGLGAAGGSPRAFIRMMLPNNTFSNWGELYHTLNKPSASDVGALPVNGKAASATTADKATQLTTARNIAGVPFDGTGDINLGPGNVGAVSAGGGNYSQIFRFNQVETLPKESNPVQLVSAASGQAADSFVAWSSYTWYNDYVRTGIVRAGDNTVKSFAVEVNGVRVLEIGRDGTFLNGNMASDLRLGQQESMNVTIPATGQSTDSVVPSGCYVTGLTSTSTGNYVGITKIYYRRLQRKVGGNWVDATWL